MIEPRKLPSGKWQARHIHNGKVHAAGTYKTKREAEDITAALNTDVRRGLFDDGTEGSMLFKDWAPKALELISVKPGTLKGYEGEVRRVLLPYFGEMKLRDIYPDDVELWWKRSKKIRLSNIALSKILQMAVKSRKPESHIRTNPSREAEGVGKLVKKDRPFLEPEEFWEIYDDADPEMQLALIMLWGGSLRMGEMLGLNRAQVNLKKGTLDVTQQLMGLHEFALPKNDHVRLRVKIYDEALDVLKQHWADHPSIDPNAPALVGANGLRLSRSSIQRRWGLLRAAHGLPTMHLHDIRHLSLTIYAQGQTTTKELMDRAGHSNPATVMIYQHRAANRDAIIASNLAPITKRGAAS